MRISDWSSDVCSSDLLDSHPEIACGGESKLNVLLTQLGTALRGYNDALTKTNEKIYREEAVYRPLGHAQACAAMRYLILHHRGAVRHAAAAAGTTRTGKWIGDKDPHHKLEIPPCGARVARGSRREKMCE